ncbi:MAG TPA: DUF3054 domain-containing protein [Roseiflexaceae bacterium]|nr:DUF3054 domain-containing protein [Roseiflexaceae bacterium]
MASTHATARTPARPGRGRIAVLIFGDLIAFMLFAAIGRSSHGEAAGLDALLQVAGTAAPFVAGWLIVAPALGAYGLRTAGGARRMLGRTTLAWLAAWPLGLGLRALALQRGIPVSFALVTLASVLAILASWRGAFALLEARRSPLTSRGA